MGSHAFATSDITGEFILLGTGTSVGVPMIGCACAVCRSNNPKNNRTRASAILGLPEGNLLIDTAPDLRTQLLREAIGIVHAVAYTHGHADHIFGLDDLRLFPFQLQGPVPLFCEERVESRIRRSFDYAFSSKTQTHPGAIPKLEFRRIDTSPFDVLGATIQPMRLLHGPRFEVLGFRIGNIAYCTDTNHIPEASYEVLAGVEYFIVDALRPAPHPTHFCIEQAIEAVERVAPSQAFMTHCSHELDFEHTNASLPPNVELAYDGLRLDLKL